MNLDLIKSDLQKLGEEVFDRHTEEIFQALGAICRCRNVVQDWGMWKWRDTIWMPTAEEELPGESFQELNRTLENTEKWTEEKIPLKNFLISGVRLMAGIHKWENEKEEWFEWMSDQILVNQYSGIRLFQEYIYLMGLVKIREGSSFQELVEMFRFAVPTGKQKTYDQGCEEIGRKLRKERNASMGETVEKRFDRWIKMAKGNESAHVAARFNEIYRAMPENAFHEWVEARLSQGADLEAFRQAGYGIDEMEPEELKSFLLERKNNELRRLAELFVYGEKNVRLRLLKQLSDEEQEILLEDWMKSFYPSFWSDLESRMNNIEAHVEEVRNQSMEKD